MAHDLAGVTASLYDFIVATEAPFRSPAKRFAAARARVTESVAELVQAFAEVRERAATPIAQRLDEAMAMLRELASELRESHPTPERLRRLWKGLGTSYEALRAQIQSRSTSDGEVRLAVLKPRNLARNLFHVSMALTGVTLYELFFSRLDAIIATGTMFALFVALEVLRRRSATWNRRFSERLFKAIIRPGEVHRVPASTWYVAALFLGCVIYPKAGIQVGALVLGFGDPTAHLVGKRFGKRKLVGEKSLAGSLAFVGAAGLVSFTFLSLVTGVAPLHAALVAVVASIVGAVAELFSGAVDDNFTIPLAAGLAAAVLL